MGLVDFHIHTCNSDGDYPVETLLGLLKKQHVKYAAFTDHHFLTEANREKGITLIRGMEYDARVANHKVHILGYGMSNEALVMQYLKELKQNQKQAIMKILYRLKKKGVSIPKKYLHPDLLDISRILEGIVQSGCCATMEEARIRYYNDIYQEFHTSAVFNYEKVIEHIRDAGGVAVWAHPFRSIDNISEVYKLAKKMNYVGMQGIEFSLYESRISAGQLENIANSLNMFMTYGSDFHGSRKGQKLAELQGIVVEDYHISTFLEAINK